jgi:hypothetical protein
VKIIAVQFPDGTDVSQFPIGKTGVSVTDLTNNVVGGLILSVADVYEAPPAPPVLPSHTHDAATLIAPAPGP